MKVFTQGTPKIRRGFPEIYNSTRQNRAIPRAKTLNLFAKHLNVPTFYSWKEKIC